MNETILVVEDEALVAKDLQRSLNGLGYRVPATAGSADDALVCAERHRPDLVLMDVRIRGRDDGITAAAALRRRFGVPVVYLTAYGDSATVTRAKATSPYGYLLKPIKAEELRITVELALHKHALDRELRTRERWHGTTLRSIADAVIAIDADRRVVSLNRAAEILTGWCAADAIGRPCAEVFQLVVPDSGQPIPLEPRPPAAAAHVDGALTGRDGQVRLVNDAVAPIVDDDGHQLGAVVVLRDVEPERKLQQQLELARRMAALGTLAAGVAHEINNPLAYIRTNIAVVRATLVDHRAQAHRRVLARRRQRRPRRRRSRRRSGPADRRRAPRLHLALVRGPGPLRRGRRPPVGGRRRRSRGPEAGAPGGGPGRDPGDPRRRPSRRSGVRQPPDQRRPGDRARRARAQLRDGPIAGRSGRPDRR
ncbi:MAG: response regulator [Myxococcales bacterium]|nr:response regulator [Myxococcales bacterium]